MDAFINPVFFSGGVTNNTSAGLTREDIERMMQMAMGMGQKFVQDPGIYAGMDKADGNSWTATEVGSHPKGARFANAIDAEYEVIDEKAPAITDGTT